MRYRNRIQYGDREYMRRYNWARKLLPVKRPRYANHEEKMADIELLMVQAPDDCRSRPRYRSVKGKGGFNYFELYFGPSL